MSDATSTNWLDEGERLRANSIMPAITASGHDQCRWCLQHTDQHLRDCPVPVLSPLLAIARAAENLYASEADCHECSHSGTEWRRLRRALKGE